MESLDRATEAGIDELLKLQETKGWKILTIYFQEKASIAKEQLVNVSANDTEQIRNLQGEVWCYRRLESAIGELLQPEYQEEQLAELIEDTPVEFLQEEDQNG
jgi:hypothetical protein